MKTQANDIFPETEWDIFSEILENDPEERMIVRNAIGKGKDDKVYSGSAYFICEEIDNIKDIQEI